MRGVERYREQGRDRFLTVEELERIGAAIVEAETTGIPWSVDEAAPNAKHLAKLKDRFTQTGPHAAAAIRLLLLTGARLREILHLRWEQVDFERAVLLQDRSKADPAKCSSHGSDRQLAAHERLIGKLLGHRQAATTQRYAHLDNDPLRRATGTIGTQIASAIGMASSAGEVVAFNRK